MICSLSPGGPYMLLNTPGSPPRSHKALEHIRTHLFRVERAAQTLLHTGVNESLSCRAAELCVRQEAQATSRLPRVGPYLVRERTPVTEELVEWPEPPAAPGSQRGFRQ